MFVLAAAGMAAARRLDGAAGTARATLSATAGANATSRCTTPAGKTFASTRATYKGTASGSPGLTGRVTIGARATIDTSDDRGREDVIALHGRLRPRFDRGLGRRPGEDHVQRRDAR